MWSKVFHDSVTVQDGEDAKLGDFVVFNPPPELAFAYGSDGFVKPGDVGIIVRISSDTHITPIKSYTCSVYFPRAVYERYKMSMSSMLFFAHPRELAKVDTELCKRYNVVAQLDNNFGEYYLCDDPSHRW